MSPETRLKDERLMSAQLLTPCTLRRERPGRQGREIGREGRGGEGRGEAGEGREGDRKGGEGRGGERGMRGRREEGDEYVFLFLR